MWDKILGLESEDIDITLDDMTGVEFAEIVCDYLKKDKAKDIKKNSSELTKHL